MNGYVYIMTNKKHGTLYIGVTSNLLYRVQEHKGKVLQGFTNRYNLDTCVYFEEHEKIYDAIVAEKRLKNWKRAWKIALIEEENPEWKDILCEHDELTRDPESSSG